MLGEQNCRKMGVSARVATCCPFQPTNGAVWKMEGVERKCDLGGSQWVCALVCALHPVMAILRLRSRE